MGDNTTIEVDGYTFEVTYETDGDSGPPWLREDGHGRVRDTRYAHWHGEGVSDKKPGERPLNKAWNKDMQYYYDWAGACKKARKEGWGPGGVYEAVEADFKYLQSWINDDWHYVTVEVTLENRTEYTRCIGGVETHKDYHLEQAEELAREVIEEYLDDMQEGKLLGMPGEEALEGAEKQKLKGMNDVR